MNRLSAARGKNERKGAEVQRGKGAKSLFLSFAPLPLCHCPLGPFFPIHIRQPCQRQLQCMRAVATVTLSFQCNVELMRQRETRKAKPHSFGFVQGNTHVLDEVFYKETWVKIVIDDARSEI